MSHEDRIVSLVLGAQRRIGRLAERDHGLSLKAISLDSGIPYPSVRSYLGQGDVKLAIMPVPVMLKLIGVIPDDLLNQLFDPVGKHLADNEPGDGDHDALAANCIEFTGKMARARHPESPGGIEIVESEDRELRAVARKLRAA